MTNTTVKFNSQITKAHNDLKAGIRLASEVVHAPYLTQNMGEPLPIYRDAEDELYSVAEDLGIENVEDAVDDYEAEFEEYVEGAMADWNVLIKRGTSWNDPFIYLAHDTVENLHDVCDSDDLNGYMDAMAEAFMPDLSLYADMMTLDQMVSGDEPSAHECNRFLGEMTERMETSAEVREYLESLEESAQAFYNAMWHASNAHEELARASEEYEDLTVQSIDSLFTEWAEGEGLA